jgi:ABC-2 type transport system permease protein
MHKTWIILKSEFWRRVRSTAFILATLLAPLGILAVTLLPVAIGEFASGTTERSIAVLDRTGQLDATLPPSVGETITLTFTDVSEDSLRAAAQAGDYDGYLVLPTGVLEGSDEAVYYSPESSGLTLNNRLEDAINDAVRDARLAAHDVAPDVRAILETSVALSSRKLTDDGSRADSSLLYTALGYVLAFSVYMAVIIYGQFVMQGVIEEKSNRVVEVVVSSVRPFELLMGKVLGIGAMGAAQMVIWASVAAAGLTFAGPIFAFFALPGEGEAAVASAGAAANATGLSLPSVPVSLFVWFVVFFVGGFLLYASLFAAVGSAVEQQQDAQNLMYPIMIPLILPILLLTFVLEAPNSLLSMGLSLFPFFTPILMPLRLAIADVPLWQSLLSVGVLAATFTGTIWLAARIYRVGIFMYGKRPGLREIARWAIRSS